MRCAGQETAESTPFKRADLSVKIIESTQKFNQTNIQSTTSVIAVFKIVGTATLHKLFEQFTATILN